MLLFLSKEDFYKIERSRLIEKTKKHFKENDKPDDLSSFLSSDDGCKSFVSDGCKSFVSTVIGGRIQKAIKANDSEYVTALLLESGINNINLHPDVVTELAWYLHNKTKPGRKKAYRNNGPQIAEAYGYGQAHLRVLGFDFFKNATDLKANICKEYCLAQREFDDIIAKYRSNRVSAYYNELFHMDSLQEDLDERGKRDLKKAESEGYFSLIKSWNRKSIEK